jgi:hypothetical protein
MLALRDSIVPGNQHRAYTTSASLQSLENPLSVSSSSGSGIGEALAHRGWSLHVGLLVLATSATLPNIWSLNPTGSWEFITTFEYEWNVIRGHHPYRWTIWVRDNGPLR